LLNLTIPELVALLSTASAVLVTLYLLDRTRRRQEVATLRFWKPAENASTMRQKRRIQQPWSLLLQLLSVALLLLAIAQIQWGDRLFGSRDHIVLLDTSAWMAARTERGSLMDDARRAALAYVRSLPEQDRAMVVRAEALATPATALDGNRAVLEDAIRESKPVSRALNLNQALEFAERVQKLHSTKAGEIVYIGAGRIPSRDSTITPPPNLRVIAIAAPAENTGLRNIGLRRADADTWEVFISAKNYGNETRTATLAVQFAGAPLGTRTLSLNPGGEQQSTFKLRTRAAGWLEARLLGNDTFPEDDRTVFEIPAQPALNVVVFSDEPDSLRPVFAASANVAATFRPVSDYKSDVKADVVVLDQFAPPVRPLPPTVWVDPPAQRSPVKVRSVAKNAKLASWDSRHTLGTGLRTRDVELESASVFTPSDGDIAVASVSAGPIILARPQSASSQKLVVLGFHPARSAMKFELATPLLFANILRWVDSSVFRSWELNAGTVGTVEAHLDKDVDPATVSIRSEDGLPVPFTVHRGHVRFFAGSPGSYRLQTGDREIVYSLTLPEIGDAAWEVPAQVRKGVPSAAAASAPVHELWPWFALAGTVGLLIEWFLFGRGRRQGSVIRRSAQSRTRVLQRKAS
jgi:hypothetical protein